MNKRLILLLLALIGFSAARLAAQRNVIDEVVWLVGDEPILRSDIENQKLYLKSENKQISGKPDCFIPEQIAVQKLFLNQAKIDSIEVEEGQINRYVEMKMQNDIAKYFGTRERMEEYFNKKHSQIRDEWRRQFRESEIVRQMQQKIVSSVRVNPSEIRAFYSKTPTDSLPFVPTTVEVQMIALKPEVALAVTDAIKSRLRGYAEEVNEGKRDFSTLARLYSEDKRTAMQGGEYGFVGRTSLEPEFADIVFNMDPDNKRVSQVIKTDEGYHIVQLIEKRGDMINFRQILLKPAIADSAITAVEARLSKILSEIQGGKTTFEAAAEKHSEDTHTHINGGLMINDNEESEMMGSSRFQMEELPQDISREISKMKTGDVSQPFLLTTKTGRKEVVIVKLRNKLEGHRADMTNDFQTIKAMALNERKQTAIDNWVKAKQKETYVYIDPRFRDCEFHYPGWLQKRD